MQAATRLGLLIGTSRNGGNGLGLASWLHKVLDERLNTAGQAKTVDVVPVDPSKPPHPLGPVVYGGKPPAQIPDSMSYTAPAIRDWSRFVSSCAGFVVLSPEYNSGYPGELKNALDHLYHEWNGKPVMLVTYGGTGGAKCAAQLQTVLSALRMDVVPDPVGITLPMPYLAGSDRVSPNGDFPDFLTSYVDPVSASVDKLKALLLAKHTQAPKT
jgi:NAD(P)H-dependent FMN reductase